MEAVRNVWMLFCIDTNNQPKTSLHVAIVLGWRRYLFQVDEPVYIYIYIYIHTRGLLEKYPTFGREKETGLLGALDT